MTPSGDDESPDRDQFFEQYNQEELLHAMDMVADENGLLPEELRDYQQAFDQFAIDSSQRNEYRQAIQLRETLFKATPRILVTPVLVALNILVYVAMVATGVNFMSPTVTDLIAWGANSGPQTLGGESWRLLSCTFLHIGLIHIGMNMFVLWQIGNILERLTGNVGFLVLYLGSGVIASLVSVYYNSSVVSAGASGAVFGTFGGLVAFLYRNSDGGLEIFKPLLTSVTKILLLNLVLGFMIPGIDMAAHVGGLIAGLLLGAILRRPVTDTTVATRTVRNALALGVSLGIIYIGLQQAPAAPVDRLAILEQAQSLETEINKYAKETRTWSDTSQRRRKEMMASDAEGLPALVTKFSDTIDATMLPKWESLRDGVTQLKQQWDADQKPFDEMLKFIKQHCDFLRELKDRF
ncbi:MAG: rhomboid family intramembrane serine protease, partial [Pirellulaceae bacterium]|nr:rhomboid family intramembrane serine protease [Pirellulaceae bacterium]